MDTQPRGDEPGYLLGAVLLGILVALLAAAWVTGMSTEKPAPPGTGPVFMGLFLIALGLMFLASYFQPWRSFFLRWLLKFSMGFPALANRKMAIFFSLLCIFTGVGAIADGLGIDFL
jgi:hypothetical protein